MSDPYKTAKRSTLLTLKILSGLVVSYVIALIGQELIEYGTFSFIFIIISITSAFLYVIKGHGFFLIFLIDGCLVACALLLKFYVLLAYGS